jgi:hypothetical protein
MHGILHRNGAPGRNAEDVSGKRASEKRLFSRGNQQTKAGPARMLAPSSYERLVGFPHLTTSGFGEPPPLKSKSSPPELKFIWLFW